MRQRQDPDCDFPDPGPDRRETRRYGGNVWLLVWYCWNYGSIEYLNDFLIVSYSESEDY